MSKSVKFRTALAGYHKQDVNDYIALRAKEMKLQLEEKEQAISSLSREMAALEKKEQEKREQVKSRLGDRAAVLAQQIHQAKQAANEVLSQLAQADEQVKKGLADAEKAKKYDQLAQGLGQLLNVEVKVAEEAAPQLPDRSALSASVLASLQALSDTLLHLQADLEAEQ